jgi:hypothetical protein
MSYDPRWARSLHEASHAIISLCLRQIVPLVEIDDPDASFCASYDPKPGPDRVMRRCVVLYAGAHACELWLGSADGCGANGDFERVREVLATLSEPDRREVAHEAWALSKRLVLLNEAAIHMLARRLYYAGRMDFKQILDLPRGQPGHRRIVRRAKAAA